MFLVDQWVSIHLLILRVCHLNVSMWTRTISPATWDHPKSTISTISMMSKICMGNWLIIAISHVLDTHTHTHLYIFISFYNI